MQRQASRRWHIPILSVVACGAFVVLKLAGAFTWSWWWVLAAPTALGGAGLVAALAAGAIAVLILRLRHRRFMQVVRRNHREMLDLQPPFHEFGYMHGYLGFGRAYQMRWGSPAASTDTGAAGNDAGPGPSQH